MLIEINMFIACANCDQCKWSTTTNKAECDTDKCATGYTRKTTGECQSKWELYMYMVFSHLWQVFIATYVFICVYMYIYYMYIYYTISIYICVMCICMHNNIYIYMYIFDHCYVSWVMFELCVLYHILQKLSPCLWPDFYLYNIGSIWVQSSFQLSIRSANRNATLSCEFLYTAYCR